MLSGAKHAEMHDHMKGNFKDALIGIYSRHQILAQNGQF